MRVLYQITFVAVVVFIAWHLFAPPHLTATHRIGQLLGNLEAAMIKERLSAAAEQSETLHEAEAKVQRRTLAATKAIEAEAYIASQQIAKVDGTLWVKGLGANVADLACGMGALGMAMETEDADKMLAYCSVGDDIRRSMAEDYQEALSDTRTTLVEDMRRAFEDTQAEK